MSDTIQIFEDQPLQLTLRTYVDLSSGVADVKIKYLKPDGETEGEWTAYVADTTNVAANIAGGLLDQEGQWYFHAYVKFTGTTHYTPGSRAGQYIRILFER